MRFKGPYSQACICVGPRSVRIKNWTVPRYKYNQSAFSGYHYTPSDYSDVHCNICKRTWRTKAEYVEDLL